MQTSSHLAQTGDPRTVSRALSIFGPVALIILIGFYWNGVTDLFDTWAREEYSHGYLVPPIALFLLLRGLGSTDASQDQAAWTSIAICFLAAALGVLGALGGIADITQYGLVAALTGVVVALVGTKSAFKLWPAILYLAFMVPLPQFLYLKLSSVMQIISSELGVGFIRLVGIPVFLEGNIIDLGIYKLQVAEACDGLRYLFPLMSFGWLFAVLYKGAWWHRVILFLSTIPITILMNSFRVGVIGVLVDRFGIEQAEGFLHYFEGWVIFIACVSLLFAIAYLLSRWGEMRRPLSDVLDFGFERLGDGAKRLSHVSDIRPLAAISVLFLLVFAGLHTLPSQAKVALERTPMVVFPATLDRWQGRQIALDPEILRVLASDDYLMADYVSTDSNESVNFFMSYYDDQTDGRAVHSPEVCIPGSGWEIAHLEQKSLVADNKSGEPITLLRAIIQKGTSRQLVYFWFAERGRQLTNEYVVKWHIFADGLITGRTDGGLVRLVTRIDGQDGTMDADKRLTEFLRLVYPRIPEFIPS